jgi:Protein of unknown function (DUF1761)
MYFCALFHKSVLKMLTLNWPVIFATGILPLLIGAIYYHPKVLGMASARASGISESDLAIRYSPKVYIYVLLLSMLFSLFLVPVVLHATHIFSMVATPAGPPEAGSPADLDAIAFFQKYGSGFRTFKHGAFHGIIAALFGAWPILGINALFERRGWKYIAIHLGYWVLVFALVGGTVCAFA